ncbi:MAG: hypothetical protein QM719_05765 [Thermomonas sp.]
MAVPTALEGGWWDEETRALVARAVFTEIAIKAGGIWNPRDLERKVRVKTRDSRGQKDLSNYSNMWKGKHEPSKAILKAAILAYPKAEVELWAKHPLFFLLNRPKRDAREKQEAAIEYALDSISGPIRGLIWRSKISWDPWTGDQLLNLHESAINAILSSREFDEFTALSKFVTCIALAKYASSKGDMNSFVNACRISHNYFLEAILTTSHLYVQWSQLQVLVAKQFWLECDQVLPQELRLTPYQVEQVTRLADRLGLSDIPFAQS